MFKIEFDIIQPCSCGPMRLRWIIADNRKIWIFRIVSIRLLPSSVHLVGVREWSLLLVVFVLNRGPILWHLVVLISLVSSLLVVVQTTKVFNRIHSVLYVVRGRVDGRLIRFTSSTSRTLISFRGNDLDLHFEGVLRFSSVAKSFQRSRSLTIVSRWRKWLVWLLKGSTSASSVLIRILLDVQILARHVPWWPVWVFGVVSGWILTQFRLWRLRGHGGWLGIADHMIRMVPGLTLLVRYGVENFHGWTKILYVANAIPRRWYRIRWRRAGLSRMRAVKARKKTNHNNLIFLLQTTNRKTIHPDQ